jgi:hypothetical protein
MFQQFCGLFREHVPFLNRAVQAVFLCGLLLPRNGDRHKGEVALAYPLLC